MIETTPNRDKHHNPSGFTAIVLLLLVLTLLPLFAQATETALPTPPPQPLLFKANYNVVKDGLPIAKSRRSLIQLDDSVFVFESETQSVGVAKFFSNAHVYERSHWLISDGQVRPNKYVYQNRNHEKKRNVELLFDWNKNTITNIINGSPWTMSTVPGVKDKLSYQAQLMLDLEKNPTQSAFNYPVADGGRIKSFSLLAQANESLVIGDKTYPTVKIVRKAKGKTTTFWCAKDLRYLPIKIMQYSKNGDSVTATMEDVELLPMRPPLTSQASPKSPN